MARQDKEFEGGLGHVRTMPNKKNREKGGAVAIVCLLCWIINSDAKSPYLLGATLIWKNEISQIKKLIDSTYLYMQV